MKNFFLVRKKIEDLLRVQGEILFWYRKRIFFRKIWFDLIPSAPLPPLTPIEPWFDL